MGREIRRVPPHWDHPKQEGRHDGRLQPMHDQTFADAAREWKEGLADWEAGKRPSYISADSEYWDYAGNPPDRQYYRPWKDEDATWFQLWETVSEGTPTSPPFETAQELADYLAKHGDFWDQDRARRPSDCALFGMKFGQPGWGQERADAFVKAGWVPSMAVMRPDDGSPAVILESKDIPLATRPA